MHANVLSFQAAGDEFVKKAGAFVMDERRLEMSDLGGSRSDEARREAQVYVSIVLTGDKIVFKSTALQLVDTYRRVSEAKPLVGGVLTVDQFWNILRKENILRGVSAGS